VTSDFLRGLRRFADALHRSCPVLSADDLLQDVALHEVSGGACAERLCRIVRARNVMRSTCRRESWWQSRVDAGANLELQASPETPEATLLTAQLRRIVRARVAAHVAAAPELRPAVEVVLYEERPREVAAALQLPIDDIYRRAESLRARLRADHELQRLWAEAA